MAITKKRIPDEDRWIGSIMEKEKKYTLIKY